MSLVVAPSLSTSDAPIPTRHSAGSRPRPRHGAAGTRRGGHRRVVRAWRSPRWWRSAWWRSWSVPVSTTRCAGWHCRSATSEIIRQQAADKHLDPALIAAVIYAETKFDPRTSAAGAEGLMQILPETAHFLAHMSGGVELHDQRPGRRRRSTWPTGATTCATCSTTTAATRCSRWPPTTAAWQTSTAGWRGQTPRAGA